MRKIKIRPERRDYLLFSIGMALEDLMSETKAFTISVAGRQTILILSGLDNTISINFCDDKIEWFKRFTDFKLPENNELIQKVGEMIIELISADEITHIRFL